MATQIAIKYMALSHSVLLKPHFNNMSADPVGLTCSAISFNLSPNACQHTGVCEQSQKTSLENLTTFPHLWQYFTIPQGNAKQSVHCPMPSVQRF